MALGRVYQDSLPNKEQARTWVHRSRPKAGSLDKDDASGLLQPAAIESKMQLLLVEDQCYY